MPSDQVSENTRRAIAVMTAWASEPSGQGDFTRSVITSYLGTDEDLFGLFDGLISVAGWTLVRLEKVSGQPIEEHLQDMGRAIAPAGD